MYFEGYGIDEAFDFFDKESLGFIGKNELIYGINTLNLDFSAFELNKIIDFLELGNFTKITRKDWKTKLLKFMKENGINIFQDFAVNLLSRIKYLIEVKNANLMEAFEEEDIHKANTAGLEMLCKCLRKFGLNAKIFEIKTLIRMFREDDDSLINFKSENTGQSFSANSKKTLSLPSQETLPQKVDKDFDLNNPAFKINYRDFVYKIYEEVENNNRLYIRTGQDLLRKIFTILKMKGISVFEAFVMIDSNNSNAVSIVEFKIALKALEIKLESLEIKLVWNLFQKTRQNKVIFKYFFEAFVNAGIVEIIKLDDQLYKLLKKFVFLLSKKGNAQEVFALFDPTNKGFVTFLEFKKMIGRLHFDFRDEELEVLFKAISESDRLANKRRASKSQLSIESQSKENTISENQDNQNKAVKSERCFNFKNLVTLIAYFRSEEKTNDIIFKLDLIMKERGLTYQHVFEEFLKASDPRGYKQAKAEGTKKREGNFPALNHRDTKKALKMLGSGLTDDEIDCLVDAFDLESIPARLLDLRAKNVVAKIKKEREDRDQFLLRIIQEFRSSVIRENVSLAKLFFDFNINRDGAMGLGELQQMLDFLGLQLTKKQLRVVFDQLDFDKKEFVTLKDLEIFLHDSSREAKGNKNGKSDVQTERLSRAKEQLKTEFEKQSISLEKLISSAGLKLNEVVTFPTLEKLFASANFTLKREEIELIINEVSEGTGVCSFEELIAWSIKNNLDGRNNAKNSKILQISPNLLFNLQKYLLLLSDLELKPEEGFIYFCDNSDFCKQKDFVSLFQAFNFRFGEEDLIGITKFFDEKNTGEITRDSFIQKIDQVASLKITDDNSNVKARGNQNVSLLSLKHQTVAIIEKIYSKFLHKGYNKSQMKAAFDRNGKGLVSRSEFIAIINSLAIGISLDDIVLLFNFLDKEGMDALEVNELVDRLIDFAPDSIRDLDRNKKALSIISSIKHKVLHLNEQFVKEILSFEQRIIVNDRNIPKTLSGLSVFDFYKVLSRFNIFLDENEKMAICKNFTIRSQPEILNLESLYFAYEMCSKFDGSANLSDVEAQYLWEQRVIKQLVDQLKVSNIKFTSLIKQLDPEGFGYIRIDNFKQMLLSLNLRLSTKDVELLCKKFASNGSKDVIVIKEFQERFWGFFFGRGADLSHLNAKSKQRQIVSIFQHKIKEESGMSFTQIWNLLDRNGIGEVTLSNLRTFMNGFRFNLSNEELGMLFSSLDLKEDGVLDQFELAEIWNSNFVPETDTNRSKLSSIENEVFNNLRTIFARKFSDYQFADVEAMFAKYDSDEKGFLNKFEFRKMLIEECSLSLSENAVDQLVRSLNLSGKLRVTATAFDLKLRESHFKMLAKNNVAIELDTIDTNQRRTPIGQSQNLSYPKSHLFKKKAEPFQLRLTQKALADSGLYPLQYKKLSKADISNLDKNSSAPERPAFIAQISGQIEDVDPQGHVIIKDHFIEFFVQKMFKMAHQEFGNSLLENPTGFLTEFIKKYDEDFDGFLTIEEFFVFVSDVDPKLRNRHRMKLSQFFASSKNKNKVSILSLVCFAQEKVVIDSLNQSQQDSIIEINNKETKSILSTETVVANEHFVKLLDELDPFTNFVQSQHHTTFKLSQFYSEELPDCRGFNIPACELQLSELSTHITQYETELEELSKLINSIATKNLSENAQCYHVNSKFNTNVNMDFESLQFVRKSLAACGLPIIEESDFTVLIEHPVKQVCSFEKEVLVELCLKENKRTVKALARSFAVETEEFKLKCGISLKEYLLLCAQAHWKISKLDSESLLFKIYGVCYRKNMIDPSKTELVILEEVPESETWVSFGQLIENNGGLLRIPFMMASNAFAKVACYFLDKLSQIFDTLHKVNVSCYIVSANDFYINRETLNVKLRSIANSALLNEHGKVEIFINQEVLQQRIDTSNKFWFAAPENSDQSNTTKNYRSDSYLLGCLMNYLIFGEPYQPKPARAGADHSWDIFDDEVIESICKYDYGIVFPVNKDSSAPLNGPLESCLSKKSYVGKIEKILEQSGIAVFSETTDDQQSYEHVNDAGKLLDLIALLLSTEPNQRPTIRSVLNGKLLSKDWISGILGQQYTSLIFSYQSASKLLVKQVLQPITELAISLFDNEKIDILDQLNNIYSVLSSSLNSSKSLIPKQAQKNIVEIKNPKSDIQTQYSLNNHLKCPQSSLIDFMMNYQIFDLLLFLSLKYHHLNYERSVKLGVLVDKKIMEPLESFKTLLKLLLDATNSPSNVAGNYVDVFLTLLVKFVLGEPFMLLSENLSFVNEFYNLSWKSNLAKEYEKLDDLRANFKLISSILFDAKIKEKLNNLFFNKYVLTETFLLKNCWTPLLAKVALPCLKDVIGNAGLGSVQYPALQICLSRAVASSNPYFEKVSQFVDDTEKYSKHVFSYGPEYLEELFGLAKICEDLLVGSVGHTTIKLTLNALYITIASKNIHKIKAVLDSKIIGHAVKYLGHDDPHIRENVLILFEKITEIYGKEHLRSFDVDYMLTSYLRDCNDSLRKPTVQFKSVAKPDVDFKDVQRAFGVVAHFMHVEEDTNDRNAYLACFEATGSQAENDKIAECLKAISMCLKTNSFILNIVENLKRTVELDRNKERIIRIIEHLTNNGNNIIMHLSHPAMDLWLILAIFMPTRTAPNKRARTENLMPISKWLFERIFLDKRELLLDELRQIPCLSTLLKDQQLNIPQNITIPRLSDSVENLHVT